MKRTTLARAAVAVALACAPGCREPKAEETTPAPPAAAPPAPTPSAARDRLAEGELVEGTERVFGIALPRGFVVKASFNDLATVTGPSRAADVANYLRARVPASATKIGAASTVFEHVQSASAPGHDFLIRVEPDPAGPGTLLTFRDVTQPKMVPDVPEAERWREAGLSPDGRILDPRHLH